jgi:hypothetical protein
MIEYNKEIIKDFILEGDPSIKRESIEFAKIYDVANYWPGDGVWLEKYIVVDYCILTIREIYGVKKEFTYCKNITIKEKEYQYRLRIETRDQKIKGLGL